MTRLLALLLISSLASAAEPIAAIVNGENILLSDVDALGARFKPPSPLHAEQQRLIRQTVLNDLIDETLLRQHLARTTPAPDPKAIDEHMAALSTAQKQLGKALSDFLRETGLTEKRLRESFDTSLRFQTFLDGKTTEADYKTYFERHRNHFEGATVRLSHILLRLPAGAESGEVAAAREKLRVLKSDLESGRVSFAEAARKHSVCVTAKSGGDLGVIQRRDPLMDEELAAAAFALPEKGISEPVRSPQGWHLIQATARTPGKPRTFEQCRDAVKDAYAEDARNRLVAELRGRATLRVTLP